MLSDEDILVEFLEENQMEVDDGDGGNDDEQQEETPKQPTESDVCQAIKTLSHYRTFVCWDSMANKPVVIHDWQKY